MTAVLTRPPASPDLRSAELDNLLGTLAHLDAFKTDLVVPADRVHSRDGLLVVPDAAAFLTPNGVGTTTGAFHLSPTAIGGLGRRIAVHAPHLRRCHAYDLDLFDRTVDFGLRLLARGTKVFLRAYRQPHATTGIARAVLSDHYAALDHLPVVQGVLDGLAEANVSYAVSCDLTTDRLHLRVVCQDVTVVAPRLLNGYRNPVTGACGSDHPVVQAGFTVRNSETGLGKWELTPQVTIPVAGTVLTASDDARAGIHIGSALPVGRIHWSDTDLAAAQRQVAATTAAFVRDHVSAPYIERRIAQWSKDASRPVRDPEAVIARVCRALRYTNAQRDQILSAYLAVGQNTAAGVMHAVLAVAGELSDPDDAYAMSADASRVLRLAATPIR